MESGIIDENLGLGSVLNINNNNTNNNNGFFNFNNNYNSNNNINKVNQPPKRNMAALWDKYENKRRERTKCYRSNFK